MRYMIPYVGCVVRWNPTESVANRDMLDREWILWDKKGNTALIVENYYMCGARNQMVVSYDDCEYFCATYSMRPWIA